MKHNRIYLATLAASLSLTIGSGDASAQRKISGQLEEVIVTAQKREQNLQDVPVSVSALDAAMIERPSHEILLTSRAWFLTWVSTPY